MECKIGHIIKIDNEKLIVLVLINDNNKKYAFVNKVNDAEDDITNDYYLVEIKDDCFNKLVDEDEINRLFPKVQEKLKKELEMIS